MGCGASKCGGGDIVNMCKSEGCLVSLCKKRNDLIQAAKESRNAVSASHVLYLQSLLDFGEALDVFLKEVVTLVATVDLHSCSSEVESPLHSIEGTHLEHSSVDSRSVFLGSLTDKVYQEEKDRTKKLSSSVDSLENENQILKQEIVSCFMRSSPHVVTELHDPVQEFHASVGAEYMPNTPSMYYHPAQNTYRFPADGFGEHSGYTKNIHYYKEHNFSNYRGGSSFSHPADSSAGQEFGKYGSERPMGYYMDMHQHYCPEPDPKPIPSPPTANSTMDYFNFFRFTDDTSYHTINIFNDRVGSKYTHLDYVLLNEEIPPLEEVEEDSPSKPFNMSKDVKDTQLDTYCGTSEVQPVELNERHICLGEEIDGVDTSVGKNDNADNVGDEKIIHNATNSIEFKQAIVVKRPVIDIFEIFQVINQAFLTAYDSGKEVEEILEPEKIPYLPTGSALKGFYHVVPNALEPSTASSQMTYALRKKSACKILKKTSTGSSNTVKDISYKQGLMTLTLDKLCVLEKKLYKKVKIEENLLVVYEKLNKRCKILVNKGAEQYKIEAMQLKIKILLPKIDVSISSICAISRRLHQAVKEDLHPQLCGLIHGLSRMWKSMSQCHLSQVQAAKDAKEQHNVTKMQHWEMKHTEDLKQKVLKWQSSLCDLVSTQKAFATFLVEWLSKFWSGKEDCREDERGHSSSPCRTNDQDVAHLCTCWLQALETTSVSRASEALEEFAITLHSLWAKQNEEQTLRIRMEFLEAHINNSNRFKVSLLENGGAQELNTARKILGDLKASHDVVFDQVKYVASSCVTDCLVKVFSASESFCTDMSNAYDQINVSYVF